MTHICTVQGLLRLGDSGPVKLEDMQLKHKSTNGLINKGAHCIQVLMEAANPGEEQSQTLFGLNTHPCIKDSPLPEGRLQKQKPELQTLMLQSLPARKCPLRIPMSAPVTPKHEVPLSEVSWWPQCTTACNTPAQRCRRHTHTFCICCSGTKRCQTG